jgi:hypothetical protein
VVYSGGLTGREAETGWWYIDVERMEEGDPQQFGWELTLRHANTRPSKLEQQHVHTVTTCVHRTEITASRLIHRLHSTCIYIVVVFTQLSDNGSRIEQG